MTSPLSPEAVAQMVADREAGTPGPWRMRVNKRDDQDTCDVSICGDIFVLADLNGPQYAHQRANARRIARLPGLEAAYLTLAAENATLRASEAAAMERVKVLTELMQWSYDTLGEINPSNYDHDDVCSLNNKSIEVILALHRALTPTADKEPKT